jgi:WD repeat-containing protein 19
MFINPLLFVAEGNFTEAALGYQRASDIDNLIRVYVDHLRKIDEAVKLVRETKTKEGAKLVMRFFQGMKDYRSVVEFCLLAGMQDEALNYAKVNGQMELYAELIEADASTDTRMLAYTTGIIFTMIIMKIYSYGHCIVF